jgi:hypothetical protein
VSVVIGETHLSKALDPWKEKYLQQYSLMSVKKCMFFFSIIHVVYFNLQRREYIFRHSVTSIYSILNACVVSISVKVTLLLGMMALCMRKTTSALAGQLPHF